MQHDGHVLACLDYLVEIADRAVAHRPGERSIDPDRLVALQQVAADEIRRRQVVVTGDGVKGPAEPRRHMRDEAALAAAGRPLQQQRQRVGMGGGEDLALVAARQVEGKFVPLQGHTAVHRHHAPPTAVPCTQVAA